jgi:DNA-binding winged helix-turn-helix (wHTH) protein
MKDFWALAAAHWPYSTPRSRLGSAIGDGLVARLLDAGLLHTGALTENDAVVCPECWATARLVREDSGFVAVCTSDWECPVVHFGAAPERVYVEPAAFARSLAAALEIGGVPGTPGPVVPLGRRVLGEELAAFDFIARPGWAGLTDTLYRLARGGPRVRVVLVPDGRRLAADVPTELGGVELVWVGLDELLVVEAPLRVDLRAILSRRNFAGVVVEAAFDGLAMNETGATWRGRPLDIQASPLTLRLLRLLAERPGELVGNADLWRSLYPDDHTRVGNLARGANPEDLKDRVRFVVGSLRAALRAVDVASGELVENVRGGGYRLALGPGQVRIAS